jgi:hypothetical protein
MTPSVEMSVLDTPADGQPRLRGVVDGPRELMALLRLLQNSAMDGRLCLATDDWAGELFLDHGRVLAATCGRNHGAAVLAAMLEDASGKRFSLHPWALLEDLSVNIGDGAPSVTPDTDRNDLIASLATQVLGRVRWPIDALEVTALLESLGITDEVAAQRYNARDVFLLAEEVHGRFASRVDDDDVE